jgi:hypothetical protein
MGGRSSVRFYIHQTVDLQQDFLPGFYEFIKTPQESEAFLNCGINMVLVVIGAFNDGDFRLH